MSYWAGTLLASPIVRGSSGDTYGTHHSILGVGGYMEVNTIVERNALPVDTVNGIGFDGISSGQRRMGMLVYVYEDDTIYQLYVEPTIWDGLTSLGKVVTLGNNSNWKVFVSGENQSSSGERLVKSFEQTTHGFIVGDVVGHDGTEFVKVNNVDAATIEPLGVVSNVVDSNNFKITISGYISTAGINDINSSGLTGGSIYYLSDIAGKITDVKPTGSTNINKPILVTMSADTAVVLQYRGVYSNAGITNDLFTGYTATTQQFLNTVVTGGSNVGFFTGYTGVKTLPITFLTNSSYNGNYTSLYNYYYRDVDGYIRIGTPSDGISRRGYLRTTIPAISWIWNEYTGDGSPRGWIFVNADVSSPDVYGTSGTSVAYNTPQYTGASWNTNQSYNNGSDVIIGTVSGSLTTGSTYLAGGPVYNNKQNQELRFRTIVTESPDTLSVKHDDYFIKLSATTSLSNVENVGGGVEIYSGTSGTTVLMKTLVGDGDTTITDNGDSITISSTGGGGGVSGSFENVTRRITKTGHGFTVGNVVGWSGGTYNKAIADGNYGGEILGIVSTVVNSNTFDLTQSGYISGQTGLSPNTTYYVSDTIYGGKSAVAPTTTGYIVRPILVANTSSTGWVLPYQGYTITEPITGGTGTSGGQIYTGRTPSNVTVGALPAGSTLTGRTITSILEEMLITVINPTLTEPYNSFSDNVSSTYEYGCVIDIDYTAGFNRGCIQLSGSFQNYRSGLPNTYYYNGPGLPSSVSSILLSDSQSISNYTVSAATQTWTSCVGYDAGSQPLDSDGCDYGSPLPAGITSAKSVSVSGLYPYYWGTYASGGCPAGQGRPSVTNGLITGGTKVLASSNNTVTLSFNSTSDDYLWFAIPSISTSKTCWYVDILNNGVIGGGISPGCNLFPDLETFATCSGQLCWNNVNYKVYISNYQSAISLPMQLRNS